MTTDGLGIAKQTNADIGEVVRQNGGNLIQGHCPRGFADNNPLS
jgi:hypothetical protein